MTTQEDENIGYVPPVKTVPKDAHEIAKRGLSVANAAEEEARRMARAAKELASLDSMDAASEEDGDDDDDLLTSSNSPNNHSNDVDNIPEQRMYVQTQVEPSSSMRMPPMEDTNPSPSASRLEMYRRQRRRRKKKMIRRLVIVTILCLIMIILILYQRGKSNDNNNSLNKVTHEEEEDDSGEYEYVEVDSEDEEVIDDAAQTEL